MSNSHSIGYLILENGMCFHGLGCCPNSEVFGEVVFNTSMTGYQEILTDPSYANQIIVFTHPHLGSTGINNADHESTHIWAKGVIAREISSHSSHWQACKSLPDFLSEKNIPFLFQIDTRSLVKVLTEQGSQWGVITNSACHPAQLLDKIQQVKMSILNSLVSQVSTAKPYLYCRQLSDSFHVIVYDFGVKKNILKTLETIGCSITVVPWNTPYQTTLSFKPHGVVLSNGPGNPNECQAIFETVRQLLRKRIPIMGICLGHQILALSLGAKIMKMKYGHHGCNHPIHLQPSNRLFINTQNHHFCVSDTDLPSNLQVTARSLFDQTIQGLSYRDSPAFSFQGHPEASPGPHDLKHLFDDFLLMMRTWKEQNA